ncbi:MAG TPA: DUF4168 domain-containing protein [Rhodopila sp.]
MRRILTLTAAAALGLAPALAFAAPDQAQNQATTPAPSSAPIPDTTIGKAGAALHDVAKLQEKYQGKMDQASPEQKQGLSAQANAEAVQAIQSRGISVQEYSNVVRTAQNNPQLKQRLLNAANNAQ